MKTATSQPLTAAEIRQLIDTLLYVAWDNRQHLPTETAQDYAREVMAAAMDDPALDEWPGIVEFLSRE